MLEIQDNKCWICERDFTIEGLKICVDHCHDTGDVRGILCHKCNMGLGYFNDDIDLIIKAYSYLNGGKKDDF